MKTAITLVLLATLGGCARTEAELPPATAIGEVRLGMTPDEVFRSAGRPDVTNTLAPGDGTLTVIWTYKKYRHLALKGQGEGAPDRDFPKGCILTFGKDGKRLTSADPPAIPIPQ